MNLSWMAGAATGNRNNALYGALRVLEERKMSFFEDIRRPRETGRLLHPRDLRRDSAC